MIISAYAISGLHLLQHLFFCLPMWLVVHVFLFHPHKKQAYARGVRSGDSAGQLKNGIQKWGKLPNHGFNVRQK
jgi:TRAP-type mannitol/chloroaromatic compound transport system permease small subunit